MDYEPRAREQVPLLLDLGQEVPALLKAMESGDTDLIYTVLLRMHSKMPLADFYVCAQLFFIFFAFPSTRIFLKLFLYNLSLSVENKKLSFGSVTLH